MAPENAPTPPSTPSAPDLATAAEDLFEQVLRAVQAEGPRVPRATYRVQMNQTFTFAQARECVQYLDALGVSDLYASPFFKARPGSMHGYDLVDHNQLSPAVGTRAELDALSADLAARAMGLLLDFVPNHMGVGADNVWWTDVLENGPSSVYARFFDIDWAPLKTELRNRVLLPVLGDHYGRVLEAGAVRVRFDQGAFSLECNGSPLPINPRSYHRLLEPALAALIARRGEEHDAVLELQSILTGLAHLPPRTETRRARVAERRREKEILKRRLAALVESPDGAEVTAAIDAKVQEVNGTPGDAHSFDALDALLEEQVYRLSYWRVAAEEINYRRFFDINDLAAIHIEDPTVFAQAHRLLFQLLGEGRVTALRIDHPDGLWDPPGYFAQLQQAYLVERCRRAWQAAQPGTETADGGGGFGRLEPLVADLARRAAEDPLSPAARPLYVVAEKILARGETLPGTWPVHGTTGYDFVALLGGVFVDGANEQRFTEIYEGFTGQRTDFETLVYEKKKLILQTALASELNVLAHALKRLAERDRHSRDFTLGTLTAALREVIACFPVYRTYVTEATATLTEHDRVAVTRALRLARRRDPTTDASVYAFLRAILALELPPTVRAEDRPQWRAWVMRVQQLTSPVMAKGVEDTAFYVYTRLVSLNEVGGEPERWGGGVAAFHRGNELRQRAFPHSLLATTTHDTKRSEDVRARISVLSELPAEWHAALADWSAATAPHKASLDGQTAPDPNEEYLFYQTVLGTWPAGAEDPGDGEGAYIERIVAYMLKATKEAKVNTSWINASPDYDAALEAYVRAALAPGSAWRARFGPLARTVAFHGMWAGLAQALLKLTAPGVPDTYQGTELWDLSLVDPDNRRPVDYAARKALLADLLTPGTPDTGGTGDVARARELVAGAADGRIKLFVTHVALDARRRLPALFGAQSAYAALEAHGNRAEHVVAFARRGAVTTPGAELVTVAPRLTARMMGGRTEAPVGPVWAETWLPVTEGRFVQLFTGEVLATEERDGATVLRLDRVLADFPVALLEWSPP